MWYRICHVCYLHCRYESNENMAITCSTKVCSFGKQVVEKVEVKAHVLTTSYICLSQDITCQNFIFWCMNLSSKSFIFSDNGLHMYIFFFQLKVFHFLFSCCCIVKLFIIQHLFSIYQTEFPRYENGRYVYRINRSPMCEYMINFIHKLKHLPEKYMMNSVLENFTILQVGVPVVFWEDKPCAGTSVMLCADELTR